MAELSTTINLGFSVVGVEPATLWNSGNWGTIVWGSSGDWGTDVIKGVDNSITPTITLAFQLIKGIDNAFASEPAMGFGVLHLVEADFAPTSEIGKAASIGIDLSITPTEDMASEVLSDSAGYTYVFPSNATNLEDRDDPTWSSGTASSAGWTSASVAATTWS